ncbi:hypothetical protein NHQ30_007780 [Ciborinia camelliae]|nr:hypothetical protein NHQ30_007780 [Ciborinia camelliae]
MHANRKKFYTCCHSQLGVLGCQTSPTHDFQPSLRSIRQQEFQQTPAPSTESKFPAVVLDCEMAEVEGGYAGELILFCAIDYITGAVILDQLVRPKQVIKNMRSSIHGVSTRTLDVAFSKGKALNGWEEARSELWKYIDANTILVGHCLEYDLDALRIVHPRVVDSSILSKNEVGCNRRWGLSRLCSQLLDLEIRKNKRGIHDCLEDVLATREVVLCCTRNKEIFCKWAAVKKIEEEKLKKEREEKREIARRKSKKRAKQVKKIECGEVLFSFTNAEIDSK